ncbi:unnamed protein product [Rhizoctonia solani]|uniref:Hemerythrin-like domain-containing protein n=1 Tax=Rhizoctonia solani TaxID=456999 RepID=A0A8H3GYR2_9AGAM|nr:unnamed protein product [Rhizoctonia solani]
MLSRFPRPLFNSRLATFGPRGLNGRFIHPSASSRLDYFEEIMVDHNNFRDLHARFISAYDKRDQDEMTKIANTLVREVSLHAISEEISIYKALDENNLHDCSENDRAAHRVMKEAFKFVDSNSIATLGMDKYADAFQRACQALFQHAKEEENDHYQKLSAVLTAPQRSDLAVDYLKARRIVPSRPHPAAPDGGGLGQKIVGAIVKPVDAAIHGMKDHVPLKYEHSRIDSL